MSVVAPAMQHGYPSPMQSCFTPPQATSPLHGSMAPVSPPHLSLQSPTSMPQAVRVVRVVHYVPAPTQGQSLSSSSRQVVQNWQQQQMRGRWPADPMHSQQIRPVVGAAVMLSGEEPSRNKWAIRLGEVGTVISDDESAMPFAVQGPRGDVDWYYESDLVVVAQRCLTDERRIMGDQLFARVVKINRSLAARITAMLLDSLSDSEMTEILSSPPALAQRVEREVEVLQCPVRPLNATHLTETARAPRSPAHSTSTPPYHQVDSPSSADTHPTSYQDTPTSSRVLISPPFRGHSHAASDVQQSLSDTLCSRMPAMSPELAEKIAARIIESQDEGTVRYLVAHPDSLTEFVEGYRCSQE